MGAVLAHPSLWATAARQAVRLAPARWWSRPPFLPVPSRPYLELRLVTQYGDGSHAIEGADLVRYLRWCRQWAAWHP